MEWRRSAGTKEISPHLTTHNPWDILEHENFRSANKRSTPGPSRQNICQRTRNCDKKKVKNMLHRRYHIAHSVWMCMCIVRCTLLWSRKSNVRPTFLEKGCFWHWKGKILCNFSFWKTVLNSVWIRNRNQNFSKVGTGTATNHYGSTTQGTIHQLKIQLHIKTTSSLSH